MGKFKIQINDNWNMIYNLINSSLEKIDWFELVQFCIDYDLYKEFYLNLNVWKILVEEKNKILEEKEKEKDNDVSFL